jgi:hypothetical protein
MRDPETGEFRLFVEDISQKVPMFIATASMQGEMGELARGQDWM